MCRRSLIVKIQSQLGVERLLHSIPFAEQSNFIQTDLNFLWIILHANWEKKPWLCSFKCDKLCKKQTKRLECL